MNDGGCSRLDECSMTDEVPGVAAAALLTVKTDDCEAEARREKEVARVRVTGVMRVDNVPSHASLLRAAQVPVAAVACTSRGAPTLGSLLEIVKLTRLPVRMVREVVRGHCRKRLPAPGERVGVLRRFWCCSCSEEAPDRGKWNAPPAVGTTGVK